MLLFRFSCGLLPLFQFPGGMLHVPFPVFIRFLVVSLFPQGVFPSSHFSRLCVAHSYIMKCVATLPLSSSMLPPLSFRAICCSSASFQAACCPLSFPGFMFPNCLFPGRLQPHSCFQALGGSPTLFSRCVKAPPLQFPACYWKFPPVSMLSLVSRPF